MSSERQLSSNAVTQGPRLLPSWGSAMPQGHTGYCMQIMYREEVEGAEVRLYGQDLDLERSSSLTHSHWLKLSHMALPAAKETGECAGCMPQKEGRRGFSGHLAISSPPVTGEIEEFCQKQGAWLSVSAQPWPMGATWSPVLGDFSPISQLSGNIKLVFLSTRCAGS